MQRQANQTTLSDAALWQQDGPDGRRRKVTLNFGMPSSNRCSGADYLEQTGYVLYARPTVNPGDKVVSARRRPGCRRACGAESCWRTEGRIGSATARFTFPPAVPLCLKSVKGVVQDAAGQPKTAVIVKGTTRGVSSGTDSSFSFEGLADGAVLQVSALGYASAEIPVGNRSFVTVELKEDATLVDEVVVVGGTQKKANLTGAVDQVSSELRRTVPWPTSRRCCRAPCPTSIFRWPTASSQPLGVVQHPRQDVDRRGRIGSGC